MSSRATLPDPAATRRIRRDVRFRAALAARSVPAGWRAHGLCLRSNPDLFFPSPTDDPAPALAICAHCPVRGACLAAALNLGDCEGVWDGTLPADRQDMRLVWALPTQRAPRD